MRLFVTACIAVGVLAGPASAGFALDGPGEDLAEFAGTIQSQAERRARQAAANPAAPASPIDIEDPFYFELEQFSVDALRLSRAIDSSGRPADLRCIFRGMSADAGQRLDALNTSETAADQARVYRAIAALMQDAVNIAPAVDDEDALPEGFAPPAGCSASRG